MHVLHDNEYGTSIPSVYWNNSGNVSITRMKASYNENGDARGPVFIIAKGP